MIKNKKITILIFWSNNDEYIRAKEIFDSWRYVLNPKCTTIVNSSLKYSDACIACDTLVLRLKRVGVASVSALKNYDADIGYIPKDFENQESELGKIKIRKEY